MAAFKQTAKQREIMAVVFSYLEEGIEPTAAKIKERLSYGADITVPAIHCSIRFLIRHGMLRYGPGVKYGREGGQSVLPTPQGYRIFRPGPGL